MLRQFVDVIEMPLVDHIWKAVSGGRDLWMKVNVNPISKKGKKKDPRNCRLISLTSVPGKVMEWLILETISKHVKDKKRLEVVSKDLW